MISDQIALDSVQLPLFIDNDTFLLTVGITGMSCPDHLKQKLYSDLGQALSSRQ